MKKVILTAFLAGVLVTAQAEQIKTKEQALQECEKMAEQFPDEARAKIKEMCVCTVEKTDEAKVAELQKSGDKEEIQAYIMEITNACMVE